jgi:predicted DNA-binding transcriptional regulator YafY
MNRIDRLFGYILALQGGRRLTAAGLADRFEVSRRTVYRDMEALAELGVPVVATPGQGFSLSPGYLLPPVMFTTAEVSALALAGGLFRHFVAHDGRRALDSALRKVEAVLPEASRAELTETCRRVCLISWPHRAAPLDGELPRLIQQAMRERRRLRVTYHSRTGSGASERTLEPHVLVFYAGDWHLVGYCHDRAAVRQFRLSRMEAPHLLDDHYSMPREADARAFWANNEPQRTGDCVTRVRFSPGIARWVRERRHYAWEAEEETAAGLIATLRVDRWEELLPWLLGWGGEAEVLAPAELRARVAEEARQMLANYSEKSFDPLSLLP